MYRWRAIICCCMIWVCGRAQSPDSLLSELRAINDSISGRGLLTHRAANVFLSEAAGYYMSHSDDLSLYKNSVVADAAAGTLAIYHNLRQAVGIDAPVRGFLSIGARANIADAFIARSEGRPYNNQFGLLVKQTWVGAWRVTATSGQLRRMDTVRAAILRSLESSVRVRGDDFMSEVDLFKEYAFEYAHRQAKNLARTFDYGVFAFHWTSVGLYVPLITQIVPTAPVAGTGLAGATNKHAYPLSLNITHTRLWESSAWGRLFATLAGDVWLNNTRDGFLMDKSGAVYSGDFRQFVTPLFKGQVVYFPKNSHIGVSCLVQQAVGDYHATDVVVGLPVVLINKQAEPAMNFEFQVRFYDVGHSVGAGKGLNGRTAVGVTAGVPFSKIGF